MDEIKTKKSNNNHKVFGAIALGLLIGLTAISLIYAFKAHATLQLLLSTLIRIITG